MLLGADQAKPTARAGRIIRSVRINRLLRCSVQRNSGINATSRGLILTAHGRTPQGCRLGARSQTRPIQCTEDHSLPRIWTHASPSSSLLSSTPLAGLKPMIVPIIFVALAGFAAYKLFQFAKADADLALLSKGDHKGDAFRGKVLWITGASQGFGEVLAKYFASQGARLILSSRSREKLEAVKASCGARPEDVAILPFDLLSDMATLEAAARQADAMFDGAGIDFLVNNAGASMSALAEEVSPEVTDALFAINTVGPIKFTRAVLPCMLARGKGRIVVIGSMASKVPSPGQAVYSACKMGLYGYFTTLASELCKRGVSVTICCPGPIAAEKPTRMVYGPLGMEERPAEQGTKGGRVTAARAAQLVANAAAHGVDEAWIVGQPLLALAHIWQMVPFLGWMVMKKVGPSRAKALKEGRSGYDVKAFSSSSSKTE